MDIPVLMALAFFGGAILQLLFRRLPVSIVVPTAALSLWILFTEFLQPYQGGGASMWPIALFFVISYAAGAAIWGALLIIVIAKITRSK